eukprot:TRINITY_DN48032_c0_g1_i1.p1 TRINITY_DN48032_c0_g1~~TRINITY_DN48032_c0_g1_i1.p1  ORF type:complete len:550 (-),score=96.44 TRINITY_DN48032_c0_g1_i1:328-1977(-)
MGRITVFTLQSCHFCVRVKTLLKSKSLPFVDISLSSYPSRRKDLVSLSGRASVPQVFFNDTCIGGYAALEELGSTGALEEAGRATLAAADPGDPRLSVPSGPTAAQAAIASDVATAPPEPRFQFNDRGGRAGTVSLSDLIAMMTTPAVASPSTLQPSVALRRDRGKADRDDVSTAALAEDVDGGTKVAPYKVGGVAIGDRVWRLRRYSRCFVGEDFITWLVERFDLASRPDGLALAQQIEAKVGLWFHVCRAHPIRDAFLYYRLQIHSRDCVLNDGSPTTAPMVAARSANALVAALTRSLDRIVNAHRDDWGLVDGAAVVEDPVFLRWHVYDIRVLAGVEPLELATDTQRVTFWVNVYNLLVRHAHIARGVPRTRSQRGVFFRRMSYRLRSRTYSLMEIEHGILRGNRRPPYGLFRPLGACDARLRGCVSMPDPRIHFALNCGARSCPPVKMFSEEAVEEELRMAARAFCDENVVVDVSTRVVTLSRIFDWYRDDFAPSTGALLAVLVQQGWVGFASGVALSGMGHPTIRWAPYDWDPPVSRSIAPTYA